MDGKISEGDGAVCRKWGLGGTESAQEDVSGFQGRTNGLS